MQFCYKFAIVKRIPFGEGYGLEFCRRGRNVFRIVTEQKETGNIKSNQLTDGS